MHFLAEFFLTKYWITCCSRQGQAGPDCGSIWLSLLVRRWRWQDQWQWHVATMLAVAKPGKAVPVAAVANWWQCACSCSIPFSATTFMVQSRPAVTSHGPSGSFLKQKWQFYKEILRYPGFQLLHNNIERPVLKTEHFDSDWVFLESTSLQQICILLPIFQKVKKIPNYCSQPISNNVLEYDIVLW